MIPFAQKGNRFVATWCMVERKTSNKKRIIHTGGNDVGACAFCFGSNNERTPYALIKKTKLFAFPKFYNSPLFLLFVVCLVFVSLVLLQASFSFVVTRHSNPFNFPFSSSSFTLSSLTHSLHRHLLHIDHALYFPDFCTCGLSSLSPSYSLSYSLTPTTHPRQTDKRKHSSPEPSVCLVCEHPSNPHLILPCLLPKSDPNLFYLLPFFLVTLWSAAFVVCLILI